MYDQFEAMEEACERQLDRMFDVKTGLYRCDCGILFNPEKEGGPATSSPYSVPVCGECVERIIQELKDNPTDDMGFGINK